MTTNIKDLPEDKLLELLCTRVNNWYTIHPHGEDAWYCEQDSMKGIVKVKDYNPLADSIQGKGQAMELLDKMRHVDFYPNRISYYPKDESMMSITFHGDSRQRLIVLAAVASVCGEEVQL